MILDGKKARDFCKARLKERISSLGFSPRLAILQIGDNKESAIDIEQKKKFGASIGATVEHARFPESASAAQIEEKMRDLNGDPSVDGIILQLPVPSNLDKLSLLNLIDPKKDVDGLTDENQRRLEEGKPRFIPATAKAVMDLLDFYRIDPSEKKAVVLGRSRLVGHPIAEMLKLRGARVEVCHSKTPDVPKKAKTADILVAAVGKPWLVDAEYIKNQDVTVIDVGINSVKGDVLENEIPRRKVVGDVDFENVEPRVAAITPVPGGVGPMTVLSLFDNLISAAEERCRRQ